MDSKWKRWICIYRAFLNSKKTLTEGRRLPRDISVENPTHQEIRDVLSTTGLRIGFENKLYTRERSKERLHRGRIRVELKMMMVHQLKKNFLLENLLSIPKLKTRQNRPTEQQLQAVQQSKNKNKGKEDDNLL